MRTLLLPLFLSLCLTQLPAQAKSDHHPAPMRELVHLIELLELTDDQTASLKAYYAESLRGEWEDGAGVDERSAESSSIRGRYQRKREKAIKRLLDARQLKLFETYLHQRDVKEVSIPLTDDEG